MASERGYYLDPPSPEECTLPRDSVPLLSECMEQEDPAAWLLECHPPVNLADHLLRVSFFHSLPLRGEGQQMRMAPRSTKMILVVEAASFSLRKKRETSHSSWGGGPRGRGTEDSLRARGDGEGQRMWMLRWSTVMSLVVETMVFPPS